jgi:GNAT superfamily N-acetyltransferase
MIRKLERAEYEQAALLALNIYMQCGTEDFDEEGLQTFKDFIFSEQAMDELTIYGAFEKGKLIGIIGTKHTGKHISLFFIRKEYHRRGIGRNLFNYFLNDCPTDEITVNSSTYAIPFYQNLGFDKSSDKQKVNGITFTPMKYIQSRNTK